MYEMEESMGTFITGTILAAVIALIVRKMVRDKKNGKTSCCGDCGNCRKGCH